MSYNFLMIDSYGRNITYLRLSVTDLCNLRCRYCMPAEGVAKRNHEEMLSEEEMVTAVRAASRLGVKKVRITGGEPLVKRNILSICRRISALDGIEEVCLTTNGTFLPDLAIKLREAGIQRINISLDTLDEKKYKSITRIGNFHQAWDGIIAALDAGFAQVKINTVLIGGFNDDEIPSLAGLTKKYPLDIRFIELMPMVDRSEFGAEAYLPGQAVLDRLSGLESVQEQDGIAIQYQFPGAFGRIGLINPISDHFCGSCNRIRLTSDGRIKPCLHRPAELSIKGLSEEEMLHTFEQAIISKPAWHGKLSQFHPSHAGRSMNQIGG